MFATTPQKAPRSTIARWWRASNRDVAPTWRSRNTKRRRASAISVTEPRDRAGWSVWPRWHTLSAVAWSYQLIRPSDSELGTHIEQRVMGNQIASSRRRSVQTGPTIPSEDADVRRSRSVDARRLAQSDGVFLECELHWFSFVSGALIVRSWRCGPRSSLVK